MLTYAQILLAAYGVLLIAGGIIGKLRADSTPSLVAGSLCGLASFYALWLTFTNPILGLLIGTMLSLLLIGIFHRAGSHPKRASLRRFARVSTSLTDTPGLRWGHRYHKGRPCASRGRPLLVPRPLIAPDIRPDPYPVATSTERFRGQIASAMPPRMMAAPR